MDHTQETINATSKSVNTDDVKNIINDTEMHLTDEELDQISGGISTSRPDTIGKDERKQRGYSI